MAKRTGLYDTSLYQLCYRRLIAKTAFRAAFNTAILSDLSITRQLSTNRHGSMKWKQICSLLTSKLRSSIYLYAQRCIRPSYITVVAYHSVEIQLNSMWISRTCKHIFLIKYFLTNRLKWHSIVGIGVFFFLLHFHIRSSLSVILVVVSILSDEFILSL